MMKFGRIEWDGDTRQGRSLRWNYWKILEIQMAVEYIGRAARLITSSRGLGLE